MESLQNFEIVDHPSDTGIKINAKTIERLFEIAATGMFSIMSEINNVEPLIKKRVEIVRESRFNLEDMLVIWLEELLYIYEIKKMLFSKFNIQKIKASDYESNKAGDIKTGNKKTYVEAEIYGEKIDFTRHDIIVSIKAPTYHMLKIVRDKNSGSWQGQIIFDV